MWPKFSRRQRHEGKHTPGQSPAPLAYPHDGSSPQLPVHQRLFSESTEAWMRQMVEIDRAQAGDFDSQANDLLEQAQILRRRAADFQHYLDGATSAESTADRGISNPNADAEVRHWTDGAWQPLCGELSGTVAQSRDTVTCPSCTEQLGNPPVGAPTAVDTGELSRYFEQPQQSVATGLWQPPAAAQQFPQSPQIDLPGVLAAAKDGAERLAAVTATPPWPGSDENAPLYGRGVPEAEQSRDGHTREIAHVGGVA